MVKNSTMGKLRMVKAMTGRAIPRIRFLKVIYVQTFCMPRENYVKEQVPEGVVLASKTSDKVERRQPQEQQPGAIPHLQHVDKDTEVKCNKIKIERTVKGNKVEIYKAYFITLDNSKQITFNTKTFKHGG